MAGWIKLHRKILDSPMYRQLNSKQRDVMLTIMLLASHESNEWEFGGVVYKVEPGQFVTSIDAIQKKCASDVSVQNIRTSLSKLEKHNFLTNQPTNKNRLITVVNWALYQGESQQATNKQINKQLTSKSTNKKTSKTVDNKGFAELDDDELTSKLNENQQALVVKTNNYKEERSKEEKKDIKTSSSRNKKTAYSEDDRYYKMAVYFYGKVMSHAAINKIAHLIENADMQKWADEFRKIVELDKREPKEIADVINWCTADSFWQVNILAPAKLRKQFVQLAVKSKGKPVQTGSLSKASKNKNLLQEVHNESSGGFESVRSIHGSLPFSGIE